MRLKKFDINNLITPNTKSISFNKMCSSYNSIIHFYSSPLGSKLGEPYKHMEKNRMIEIITKSLQSNSLDERYILRSKEMLRHLGIENI
jgi:hypothetical protein